MQDDEFELSNGHEGQTDEKMPVTHFSDVWEKDFHVSPFNSRKGSYSLRATDPLAAYSENGQVQIDNTVVLGSSKESPKLVARVYSEGVPQEADTISMLRLTRFIASWWWVGFITFPRIVWQAQKLFFRRKLQVWYRPEVIGTGIGRSYTDDERHLETIFAAFVEYAVEHIKTPLRIVYQSAHSNGEDKVMYTPGYTYEEGHQHTLTLQILSPAFYSRFVYYAHAKEAFDREYLATDEKNQTLVIKNPSLLPILLEAMHKVSNQSDQGSPGALSNSRWLLVERLRCPPAEASYLSGTSPEHDVMDIRSFRASELDSYVKQFPKHATKYCRIVTKLFLAQRLAFGIPAVITGVDWMFRACMFWAVVYACHNNDFGDVLRPGKFGPQEAFVTAGLMLLANAVHLWSFAKG